MDCMANYAKSMKEADDLAERSALAFVLGRFPVFWEDIHGRGARERLEKRYAELGGDSGTASNDATARTGQALG